MPFLIMTRFHSSIEWQNGYYAGLLADKKKTLACQCQPNARLTHFSTSLACNIKYYQVASTNLYFLNKLYQVVPNIIYFQILLAHPLLDKLSVQQRPNGVPANALNPRIRVHQEVQHRVPLLAGVLVQGLHATGLGVGGEGGGHVPGGASARG